MQKPIETLIIRDDRFKNHIAKTDGGTRTVFGNRFWARQNGKTTIIHYFKEEKTKIEFFNKEI